MAESCVIEVYENETHGRSGGWVSYAECPFIMKATMTPCKPIEEINVPSSEWAWSTNWKITKMPGVTDAEGWEYASRFSRFKIKDRAPKSEARWSRARRRLWTRIMRREPVVKTTDMTKVLSKVQGGLTSIHSARIKIEQIMRSAPEAATSDQMKSLVASVERNIADILSVLDQAEQQAQQSSSTSANGSAKASTSPAVLKKLRNDVLKEQMAIERALDGGSPMNSSGSGSAGAGAGANSRSGSSFSVGNRTSNNVYAGSGGVLSSSYSSSYINGTHPTNSYAQSSRASFTNMPTVNYTRGTSNSMIGHNQSNERTSSTELRQDIQGISRMLAPNKTVVKSGSAGAFNPTIFANNSRSGGGDPDDGDFVDRSTQELMIEQRLVAIDESTVMQEIIDDRHVEIEKIHKGLVEINEMFTDLSRMVKEQESEIGQIYGNIEESHAKTKEAFANVIAANRLQQSGQCIIS